MARGEVMEQQLAFNFMALIDRELAEKVETDRRESKQLNADAHLAWCVEHYPPTSEEWGIILMGIRLSRHVHEFECARCKLGPYNHCPDALGVYWDPVHKNYNPVKVCLKDYYRWLTQHGLKAWVKEALERDG